MRNLLQGAPAIRLLPVGVILVAVVVAFAYDGGWLSPDALTPARLVDTLEFVNGVQPSFRRNHAKGVCVSGTFESNGEGTRLSKAAVFPRGRVPVVGRFALAGGMPYQPDANSTVRSMALRFSLPNGEEWRTGMNNIPVFPVNTAEAFREQMLAMRPDATTGKPDPARMRGFLESHPESARAIATIKAHPIASGFDNSTYNSLDAFFFVSSSGKRTAVRWSMVPLQPFAPDPAAQAKDPNFLFDGLIDSVHRHPLAWRMMITVGHADDPTNDATIAWPRDREQVDVGTLTIDRIESEDSTSPVRNINFDPLVLPNGIASSDDPLLSARSATYSVSFRRRVGEPEAPSAVTPGEVAR